MEELNLHSYNSKDVAKIKAALSNCFRQKSPWLAKEFDLIFQICDELIKNAFKANYRFLFYWNAISDNIHKEGSKLTNQEVDAWLKEIFYSGSNDLIEKKLEKVTNKEQVSEQVRCLMRLENKAHMRNKSISKRNKLRIDPKYKPLLQLRKQAKKYRICVSFKIEDAGSQLLISVSNNTPILENDVVRIQNVRERFKEYYDANRPEYFFIENIDISGGGHGLGYALMDSILLQIGLEPYKTLYLVSAGTAMVLLNLPKKQAVSSPA